MTPQEALEIVSNAVEQTENLPADKVAQGRLRMACWLYAKFKIGIKQLVMRAEDGLPYLEIEFENEKGEREDCYLSMQKYTEKLATEIEKSQEGLVDDVAMSELQKNESES